MDEPLTIVDDSELMTLAADRTQLLFPVIDRTAAMWPLLVMLATVPTLIAIQCHTFDESDARWGMLAIQSVSTPDVTVKRNDQVLARDVASSNDKNTWVPPVGMWWNALFLKLGFGQSLWSLYLGSYVATALEIGASFWLGRRLFGPQLNFWAIILLSFHACLLGQVQTPAPISLAVFLSLVTFWGFISHRQNSDALISWRLFIAGVSIGLCAMTAGPLALLLIAVMLIHVLSLRGTVRLGKRRVSEPVRKGWIGWSAFRSLGVVTIIGTIVAGAVFVQTWGLAGWGKVTWSQPWHDGNTPMIVTDEFGMADDSAWHAILFLLRSALGLSVYGFFGMFAEMVRTPDPVRRRRLQFVLAWSAIALAFWFVTWFGTGAFSFLTGMWQAFALPPVAMLAGYAVEEIRQRRCRLPLIGMIWGSSLAGIILIKQIDPADPWQQNYVAMSAMSILAFMFILFSWFEGRWLTGDRRRRVFVSFVLVMLLLTHAINGLYSVWQKNDDDIAIRTLQRELRNFSDVTNCAVISDRNSPAQLQYMVETLWPRADLVVTDTWSTAVSLGIADAERDRSTEPMIILDWRRHGEPPVTMQARGLKLQSIAPPRFFGKKQLRAYQLPLY